MGSQESLIVGRDLEDDLAAWTVRAHISDARVEAARITEQNYSRYTVLANLDRHLSRNNAKRAVRLRERNLVARSIRRGHEQLDANGALPRATRRLQFVI
jgi:hypothetical protein